MNYPGIEMRMNGEWRRYTTSLLLLFLASAVGCISITRQSTSDSCGDIIKSHRQAAYRRYPRESAATSYSYLMSFPGRQRECLLASIAKEEGGNRKVLAGNMVSCANTGFFEDREGCEEVALYLLKNDPDPEIRLIVASGLHGMNRARVQSALVMALLDSNARVRRFTLENLRFLGDRSIGDSVLPLLDDPVPEVRSSALTALAQVGTARALPRIRRLYQEDKSAKSNPEFVRAFAMLGDVDAAMEAAKPLLRDANHNIRFWAASSFRYMRSDAIVPRLIASLPTEMELLLQEGKTWKGRLTDRTFMLLIDELTRQTGEQHGRNVPRWLGWWKANSQRYGDCGETLPDPDHVQRLQEEYDRIYEPDKKIDPLIEDATVTSSKVDIYGDGRTETVSLVMTLGKKYHDEEQWCGAGNKYEGDFSIVVTFPDGRRLATELKPLVPCMSFFYSDPWSIYFADYNHDGVLDFNLGQYAGCNGSSYTLFTFSRDGKVLCIGSASLSGHANSTDKITLTDKGYSDSFYNNAIGGPTQTFYEWDATSQAFEPALQIDCHDCLGNLRERLVEMSFNKKTKQFEAVKEVERIRNEETGRYEIIKEMIFDPNQSQQNDGPPVRR